MLKKCYYLNRKMIVILFWISIFVESSALAQSVFEEALEISVGVNIQHLVFDVSPEAKDGIDISLGEEEQPPIPPTGSFDSRFIGSSIGEGLLKDIRFGNSSFIGTHVHELSYQVGNGNEIKIS